MKPKTRFILEMAIEQGVRRGYLRAHKHKAFGDVVSAFCKEDN